MMLNIKQGPNSLETLTQIDPVSIAEFLGNVGGFWGELTTPRTRMHFGRKDLPQSREEHQQLPSDRTMTLLWGDM